MRGNWVNWGDVVVVAEKIAIRWPRLLKSIVASPRERTRQQWCHAPLAVAPPPFTIPQLRRRWNRMISGYPTVDHRQFVTCRYLEGRQGLVALSLGCGEGGNEAAWAATGRFARIDALDLSPSRIAAAQAMACDRHLEEILHFQVADVPRQPFPLPHYDVVLCEHSLHHLAPVAKTIAAISSALAPDGLLVVADFCGPDRFQWTKRQLEIVAARLAEIPPALRTKPSGRVKRRVYRPGRLRMILSDPSEAAESSQILPEIHRHFVPLREVPLGGTVLGLLFYEISHHYLTLTAEALAVLERVCAEEDRHLAAGDLASDYFFGVYRPRGVPGTELGGRSG
ncbi:MAG TPA: class I SAM-dependent methyltransferase [Candidatus Aminicenantes bacterium]|nr:class I SAM-dependent methyltransferase [Candidatus Aminicenantes bacterium]